jgi:trans-aconitate 2-methyltransferase
MKASIDSKPDAWNIAQYEKFKAERAQPFYDLMAMVEPITGGRLVDLGCGSGELTRVLHQKLEAADTLGIDSSANMLEKAKGFLADGLHFDHQPIERFSEPYGYDLIFSNSAIQWCDNHYALFHNLRASLKKDGQIAIQMPMNQDYISHTVATDLANQPKYKKYLQKTDERPQQLSMLKPDDYASLLFDLGFKQQKVVVNVYGHVLESREMVVEWVKGTMLTYYQKVLPESAYKEFFKDYQAALFAVMPERRPFFYPFKRILMWASLRAQ